MGCLQRHSHFSPEDLEEMESLLLAQMSSFQKMDDGSKHAFVKLCNDAGEAYANAKGGFQSQQCVYCLPLSTRNQTSMYLCSHCYNANLELDDHLMATIKNAPVTTKNDTTSNNILKVHQWLQMHASTNNAAVVVPYSELLQKYDHRIILKDPYFKKSRHCRDGLIYYSDEFTWNGKKYKTNKKSDECHEYVIDPLCKQESIVIATKKVELDRCINAAGIKIDYQYPNDGGQTFASKTSYVILCAMATFEDNQHDFHPVDIDLQLFQKHKNNIVQTGKHYGSKGYYFANGLHASYGKGSDGLPVSINQYATKNKNDLSYKSLQKKLDQVTTLIIHCNRSLSLGTDIVRSSAQNTINNAELAQTINSILGENIQQTINLRPLSTNAESAVFPSVNVCVNASTSVFHTENDQGYTMIAVPYQVTTSEASFLFRISNKIILSAKMKPGVSILFNARLLSHRQNLNKQPPHINFWNIGCYANRRFNQHTYSLFRRQFSKVITGIHQYLNNNNNE